MSLMGYYDKFPKPENLIQNEVQLNSWTSVKVNAHLHSPFSFSAFDDIPSALDLAVAEGVKIVGINDFNSAEGYSQWAAGCNERALFPLFNIEFICLNSNDQAKGIKVNDPSNPGRTYLSGKGLAFPFTLESKYMQKLLSVQKESNRHVQLMCNRLNQILIEIEAGFTLDFDLIVETMTRGAARERHLAKALRVEIEKAYPSIPERERFYEKLFSGRKLKSPVQDKAAVEIEIRGTLLKAGGNAFIPENPGAFMEMDVARDLIIAAGGIPTYPFLADDANGNFTDFECNKEEVAQILTARGINSVEFITTRNSIEVLENYAGYFHDNGFVVTFGSEHNTPAMEPLELFARGRRELTPRLMEINLKGACVVAAHQYLVAKGKRGYVDADGNADISNRDFYQKTGLTLLNMI